jgi:hypothetical protein
MTLRPAARAGVGGSGGAQGHFPCEDIEWSVKQDVSKYKESREAASHHALRSVRLAARQSMFAPRRCKT